MPEIGSNIYTLADHMNFYDRGSAAYQAINMVVKNNELIARMPTFEASSETGHQGLQVIDQSQSTWTMYNEGVMPQHATTKVITVDCKTLENGFQLDAKLAKSGDAFNVAIDVQREDKYNSMGEACTDALIYGTGGPGSREPKGLSSYYYTVNPATDPIASNVINAGGQTASGNTSVWLIQPGLDKMAMFYPKGSKAGLQQHELRERPKDMPDGSVLDVVEQYFSWKVGLFVADWRNAAVRIANIDTATLNAAGAADLIKYMTQATHRLRKKPTPKSAYFLMNRDVEAALDIQSADRVNDGNGIGYTTVHGEEIRSFRKIPILTVESIINNEARVV